MKDKIKIYDAHLHIIPRGYPLFSNQGYTPAYFEESQYQKAIENFEFVGGTIVSGSFQKDDTSYLVPILKKGFCGIINLPDEFKRQELDHLKQLGVKGIRINLKRMSQKDLDSKFELAKRFYDEYNWHTELYVENSQLKSIKKHIEGLAKVSVDHLGLTSQGLDDLYELVAKGLKVKATGFGRVEFEIVEVLKMIYSIDPRSLMFGSDLPSTRAKRPFQQSDIELILHNFTKKESDNIMFKNALDFYGLN